MSRFLQFPLQLARLTAKRLLKKRNHQGKEGRTRDKGKSDSIEFSHLDLLTVALDKPGPGHPIPQSEIYDDFGQLQQMPIAQGR